MNDVSYYHPVLGELVSHPSLDPLTKFRMLPPEAVHRHRVIEWATSGSPARWYALNGIPHCPKPQTPWDLEMVRLTIEFANRQVRNA